MPFIHGSMRLCIPILTGTRTLEEEYNANQLRLKIFFETLFSRPHSLVHAENGRAVAFPMAISAHRKGARVTEPEAADARKAIASRGAPKRKATEEGVDGRRSEGNSQVRGLKAKDRPKDEIDHLFKGLDSAKVTAKKNDGAAAADKKTDKGTARSKEDVKVKKPKIAGSKDDIFGTGAVDGRKRTEEGYLIYSEEELGLGGSSKNAGYTKDCPFDCQCCF